MPKIDLGCRVRAYNASEDVRTPYYGSSVSSAEPRVLSLTAKLLPNGEVVVFGEIEVFILFTYNDGGSHTNCFLETLRKEFCEVLDGGEVELTGLEPQDVSVDVSFRPQVSCALAKKSGYLWRVEIKGDINAMLRAESYVSPRETDIYAPPVWNGPNEPEESDETEAPVVPEAPRAPQEPVATEESVESEEPVTAQEPVVPEEPSEQQSCCVCPVAEQPVAPPEEDAIVTPISGQLPEEEPCEQAEPPKPTARPDGEVILVDDVKCWRIDDALEGPLDTLFELNDDELARFSSPQKEDDQY